MLDTRNDLPKKYKWTFLKFVAVFLLGVVICLIIVVHGMFIASMESLAYYECRVYLPEKNLEMQIGTYMPIGAKPDIRAEGADVECQQVEFEPMEIQDEREVQWR